ncbi:hypothetical protein EHQ61_00785 [Leptospira wolffii]|uniref:hypothetical protein n=1 Tax=Leptospira wolffii TaxID=409998 RepID=UPI0010846A4C|nr:hypothetical protein [Leptospira wolffii]TGL55278.1 hypothetical protein EHQ61_00785 [Leptospira wolffii]
MAKQTDIKELLIEKTKEIYNSLLTSENQTLTKSQILDLLGTDLQSYYTYIIQGLTELKKVTRNQGYHGGISVNYGIKGLRQELNVANLNNLSLYYKKLDIEVTEDVEKPVSIKQEEKLEESFYPHLKDYLERTGLYEIVDINPKKQGGKWENADLALVSYESDLRFHGSIDLRLTAVEVKRGFPTVENIQQAAAYLLYANRSYICYFDDRFKGTNVDLVVSRLRDEGVWSLINSFGLGIIVSYKPTIKSEIPQFQTIKEAPYKNIDLLNIERGIELWINEESKLIIRKALARQHSKVSTLLE